MAAVAHLREVIIDQYKSNDDLMDYADRWGDGYITDEEFVFFVHGYALRNFKSSDGHEKLKAALNDAFMEHS